MLSRAKATRDARGEVAVCRDLHKRQKTLCTRVHAGIPGGGRHESRQVQDRCYKQYRGIFKIDIEMKCYLFVTGDSCVIVV
jgi:hypothetical protein